MDHLCAVAQNGSTTHHVVAHVRVGDSANDARGVLRRADGWSTIRRCLPRDAYLLSDSDRAFRELPGHHHPRETIRHTAVGVRPKEQLRAVWGEWCMIRSAAVVYHTPSGFSESAFYFSSPKRVVRMDEDFNCP